MFQKEERINAQRELKAFLKGNDIYKAKVFIPGKDGGWKWMFKKVNRG